MSNKKKQIRSEFRKAVFTRDNYTCRCCGIKGQDRQEGDKGLPDLDSHHVTPREKLPNGGYVKENGISLCDDCHVKAEDWLQNGDGAPGFDPESLYQLIGSSFEEAVEASEKLR